MNFNKRSLIGMLTLVMLLFPMSTFAFTSLSVPHIAGIRFEFIIFALTLVGVAVFHHKTMQVALIGLLSVVLFKLFFDTDYSFMHHLFGENSFISQIVDKHTRQGEWTILLNLFALLLGFAVLAKYFEDSGVPEWLPKILPDDWKGGLILLIIVFVMSAFLDNIAAAMIGGAIALAVYNGKVHIGYLAAIIAASNAGGSGSVVGDTTTTLMWIDGVSALDVTHAWIGSIGAFLIFGIVGAKLQDRYQKIQKNERFLNKIDYSKLMIVVLILIGAVATNILFDFPALGVWGAILIGNFIKKAPFGEVKHSMNGAIFLTALVTTASMMPVDELPNASWQTAFTLGFVSSVFDNIPLTKLALAQGGYDWGVLAYAVGFGGSMLWFGSSAGVALSNSYPKLRSVADYVKNAWFVIIAYIVGFFIMLAIAGWNPHAPHKDSHQAKEHVSNLHPISDVIK